MKVNKLTFSSVEIKIKKVEIPSYSFFKVYEPLIRTISPEWWIKGPKAQDTYTISRDPCKPLSSAHNVTPANNFAGVRPAVYFISKKLKQGDRFAVGRYLFTVLFTGLALCDTVVEYSRFTNIDNTLTRWSTLNSCTTVNKVIASDEVNISIASYGLFPVTEAMHTDFNSMETNCGYWLLGRADEFTAYYSNTLGEIQRMDITAKLDICPVLYLDEPHGFKLHDVFEYDGYYFLILSNSIALCKNTVGISCYSTGLISCAEETEKDFYEISEVKEIVDTWYENLRFVQKLRRQKQKEERLQWQSQVINKQP